MHSLGLEIRDLCARRGHRLLFEGLDLSIGPGQIVALTGPNGSGKSTLLRLVAGYSRADAGTIAWQDQGADEPATHIHYLGHRDGLRDALSASENLEFLAAMLGGRSTSIPAAFEQLEIARLARLPVAVLSAGQRRRVALARLLVAPRACWLLDEPFAALDAAGQATVTALLQTHAAKGGLALVATHQPLGLDAGVLNLKKPRSLAA